MKDLLLKHKLIVLGTSLVGGGVLLWLLLKKDNTRKSLQEIEQLVLQKSDQEELKKKGIYSPKVTCKIHSLIIDSNTYKYKQLVYSNRQQRRAVINKDRKQYLDLLVKYNSDYIKLLDDESIFKQSKIITAEVYKKSIAQYGNNKDFRSIQQRDIIQLKQSIPSKLQGFTAQDASDAISFMLGVIKELDHGLKEHIDSIIQRNDVQGLLYGMISSILYDIVNLSDKFKDIEEEDILRFIHTNNDTDRNIVLPSYTILTKSIFSLMNYVQSQKN